MSLGNSSFFVVIHNISFIGGETRRRFHARFFLVFLPSASSSGFGSGEKRNRTPTPDGGQEVISAKFLRPRDALANYHAGTISLFPPQFYILSTLSEALTGRQNTLAEREKVFALSQGSFGRMVIKPKPLPQEDGQKHFVLTFEGDETRGGSKGRRHRVIGENGGQGAVGVISIWHSLMLIALSVPPFNDS